jgi:cold shock CspA family protein
MASGRVVGWNTAEGYGLIQRLDGPGIGETYHCRLSAIEGSRPLQIGQAIMFRPAMDTHGRNMATSIRLVRVVTK